MALVAAAAPGLLSPAVAASKTAFTQAAFDSAKSAGGPVLVDVTASWCPTCKAQAPLLAELAAEPRFKDLRVFELNFDAHKDALRALGVRMQSTLIVYKDGQEVGRSVGETKKDAIASLLEKAI